MKQTKILMGMPITLEVADKGVSAGDLKKIFDYFKYIDQKFSTYKRDSEISKINDGRLKIKDASEDMRLIFKLADKTKRETQGYFDIYHDGKYDPSGIVKGWAIWNAAKLLKKMGFKNFYVDAGGDIQVSGSPRSTRVEAGKNNRGKKWRVGIKNPFNEKEIVKVLKIGPKTAGGVATSGTYIRGFHIYNPKGKTEDEVVSLTVIGPNIYEADRFATAAFAIGKKGIMFIEELSGFEGYMIDNSGMATMTSGFEKYVV